MLQSSIDIPRKSSGDASRKQWSRIPWKQDKRKIKQYLKIYREVVRDKIPVKIVAGDYGYTKQMVYWIVAEVDGAMRSGEMPKLLGP